MGLRDQAAADLRTILQDESGFGWPLSVTSPEGLCIRMTGLSTDVSQTIDPETGHAVSGRVASVALSMVDLQKWFGSLPKQISDRNSKPWLVTFDDVLGAPHTFKVQASNPDRVLGVITCLLETYKS